jgi:hypothetical protein
VSRRVEISPYSSAQLEGLFHVIKTDRSTTGGLRHDTLHYQAAGRRRRAG